VQSANVEPSTANAVKDDRGNILKNEFDGGEAILEAFRNLSIDFVILSA